MTFPTKEAIRQHVQDYVRRTPIGDEVTDPVLLHLYHGNTEWDEKSQGMTRIVMAEITTRGTYTSKNGLILRSDGSTAHASWTFPLDHLLRDGSFRSVDQRRDWLHRIKEAAREAVISQVQQIECPLGCDVDHVYPRTFDRLLFLFLKWWSVPLMEIQVLAVEGQDRANVFSDWELDAHWRAFHERLTRGYLRPLPADENRRARCYSIDWSRLP